MHALYLPDISESATCLRIEGDEARHAIKSKRLREGETLIVLDGRGQVATCRVASARRELELEFERRERVEPITPRIEVYSATPKGPRVEGMVDALVQVGAASWSPLRTKLGVVDPREGKLGRLERIAIEAMKQCRRPWAMELGEKMGFETALDAGAGVQIVLAHQSGVAYEASGAPTVRLLVGPEGGWIDAELDQAKAAGATVASFGPCAMRIEVAAPTAAGIILDTARRNSRS